MRGAILAALSLLAVGALVTSARPAGAHDVDVTSIARVFFDEVGERRYRLSVGDRNAPAIGERSVGLPEGCEPLRADEPDRPTTGAFEFGCDQRLTFEDSFTLRWPLDGVVLLARWSDGTDASAYFRGTGRAVPVDLEDLRAEAASVVRLARRYLVLGVEHILFGIDHLLFVLGLLLLIEGVWPLVKTVTAFTVAHSITLGAAVLGYVPVDRAPVEAAIALSIVLLAREIVMGRRGRRSLAHRAPWMIALIFGLLHGLGFAGALGEIGLRSADVPAALLFFNLGVEAGQLAFVALLLALHRLLRGSIRSWMPRLEPALGYALGVLSMVWFLDRLPAVWGA